MPLPLCLCRWDTAQEALESLQGDQTNFWRAVYNNYTHFQGVGVGGGDILCTLEICFLQASKHFSPIIPKTNIAWAGVRSPILRNSALKNSSWCSTFHSQPKGRFKAVRKKRVKKNVAFLFFLLAIERLEVKDSLWLQTDNSGGNGTREGSLCENSYDSVISAILPLHEYQ